MTKQLQALISNGVCKLNQELFFYEYFTILIGIFAFSTKYCYFLTVVGNKPNQWEPKKTCAWIPNPCTPLLNPFVLTDAK